MTTATSTEPVAVEPLPDGRELHVHADGRIVVVGAAEAREHPVPGVDWIGRSPARRRAPARRFPRPTGRLPRVMVPTDDPTPVWRVDRRVAHERADALLRSLLDETQLADYARSHQFWVEVPQGRLRFGRLYSIRFEPTGARWARILCVVPERHTELPGPDIWANLLLAVRADPDRFLAVAIDRTGPAAPPIR